MNCKTCWYHESFSGVCFNSESERVADFVEENDVCEYWEDEERYYERN